MALDMRPSEGNGDYPDSVSFKGTRKELRWLVSFLQQRINEGGPSSSHVLRSTGEELWEVFVTVTDAE